MKEDYKEGYAFGPQSDVGLLLNQKGWLPCWSRIKRQRMESRVVHQGHDAIMLDGPPEELWTLANLATSSLMEEREYPGVRGPWTLRMPVGMKVGWRWGDGMHEWKQAEKVEWTDFKRRARDAIEMARAGAATGATTHHEGGVGADAG